MNKVKSHEPWFGLEQEYTLYEADGNTLLGWSKIGTY
jgi:glutamine synthetase